MWFLNLLAEPFFVVLLLFIVAALAYVAKSSQRTRVVQVGEELDVPAPYSDVEQNVFQAVSSLKGVTVSAVSPGFYVVTQNRAHPLSIIPALLLFPIGLIFLLVHDDLVLNVTVTANREGSGSTLRLIGRAEAQRLANLKAALGPAVVN